MIPTGAESAVREMTPAPEKVPWEPEPGDCHPADWETLKPADNPLWPLPKDYDRLTEDGKKAARMDVIRNQGSPMKLVIAWDMFRRLYLMPTEPGFFYSDLKPSPRFHYEMIYDLGRFGRNIYAAPRGTAKSVVMGTEVALFLSLTRDYIRITIGMATDRLIEQRFDKLMSQYTENPFILADFGYMKPKRGEATWNHHYLKLLNGSSVAGVSVMGKKRGGRPDLFLLDDPEFDPTNETSAAVIRDKFITMLFKQVIPMLEMGSCMFWIGTMIGSRSLLYTACNGDDPRFDLWNRRVLCLEQVDSSGKRLFLWEKKYGAEFADMRKREIGESFYAQEYMNVPGAETDRILKIDRNKNLYFTEGWQSKNPMEDVSEVVYYVEEVSTGNWIRKTETYRDLTSRLYKVITTDLASGLTQYNDYSCIACVGFDSMNCMWVLDLWMGRVKDSTFLELLYAMGLKWIPKVVGIESFAEQKKVVDAATTYLREKAASGGDSWIPRVIPVDYRDVKGPKSKPDRIRSLEWRFQTGKIKYLGNAETRWPWGALFNQTRDFTYDLGMLPFDDAIDTVAMANYIVHGKGSPLNKDPDQKKTLAELFRAGEFRMGGVPIMGSVGSDRITHEVLEILEDKAAKRWEEWNEKQKRNAEGRRPIYVGRERYAGRIRSIGGPAGGGFTVGHLGAGS